VNGRAVVLLDAGQLSEPIFTLDNQLVGANHAVIGWSDEQIGDAFKVSIVEMSGLNEWLGYHPIRYDVPNEVKPGLTTGRIEFVQPEQPSVSLSDGTELRVRVGPGLKSSRYEASLRLVSRLEVTLSKPGTASTHFSHARRFRDFMAFCTEYAVQVTDAQLMKQQYEPGGPVGEPPMDWWARWNEPGPSPEDAPSWTHMNFLVREHINEWSQMVTTWFDKWAILRDPVELLLSLTFAPPTYWDTRLLLVCSAAEAYHRASIGSERWTKVEFRNRRRMVLEGIPEAERQWVSEATRYANEPTLRSRLLDLQDRSNSALPMLFDRHPDWAKVTSKMRNDYAHRGKSKKATHPPDEIFRAVEVTARVVRTCILLDLGLPANDLAMTYVGRPDYIRLVRD